MAVLFPWELARLPSGWTPQGVCSSVRARSAVARAPAGEVAERLNAPVLKTGSSSRGSWVQIPPSPPTSPDVLAGIRSHEQSNNRVRQLCGAKLDKVASATLAPSPRGVSSGPPLRTISPVPTSRHSLFILEAARIADARGFSSSGVRL